MYGKRVSKPQPPSSHALSRPGYLTVALIASAGLLLLVAASAHAAKTGVLSQLVDPQGCIVDNATPIAGCTNTGSGLSGGVASAVPPDGKSLYVASFAGNAVAIFDRNTATGEVAQKAGTTGCIVDEPSADIADCNNAGKALGISSIAGQVGAIAVSPNGASLYIATAESNAVAIFARGTTPVCSDLQAAATAPSPVAIQLACTDPDGDPVNYATASSPTRGKLSNLSPGAGTLTYTPNAFTSGRDTFTYTATADGETSNVATVAVNLAPISLISFRGGRSVRLNRRYRAAIKLRCSGGITPCQGKLALKTSSKVVVAVQGRADIARKKRKRWKLALGSKSYTIAAGKTATVRVRLNKKGRRLLRRHKRVKARATATQVASSTKRSTSRTLKVLAPKKKRAKKRRK